MTTAVVLFTRDLRVHDQPALAAACRSADRLVPLFVLDETILASRYAAPNRLRHLVDALTDLRAALRACGGELIVRRGSVADQVRELLVEVAADQLHLSADVSAYAQRRERGLRTLARELAGDLDHAIAVHAHPGVTAVPPGDVAPGSGDHFKVFTPYWRRWVDAPHRAPEPAPDTVTLPDGLDPGRIPSLAELTDGEPSPELPPGGERAARRRADWWFDGPIEGYDEGRNDLAADATSKLSPHLHLGTLSVAEVLARIDRRLPGHEVFAQELCWRDFNHQLMAARPDLVRADIRTQHDRWRDDPEALAAWQQGRTGYPVVDAGMRQLRREGWMHNRARMITASFLTKHLYLDWRDGAWHFMDHLVDGDLANNFGQWQWTAGTGTDSRPNRMFNPTTQGERYDPDGTYVRRYVEELADVESGLVHTPWRAADSLFDHDDGYPPPIVEHREARERFLASRGA